MKINEKFCCSVDFPRKTSIKVDSEVNLAWILQMPFFLNCLFICKIVPKIPLGLFNFTFLFLQGSYKVIITKFTKDQAQKCEFWVFLFGIAIFPIRPALVNFLIFIRDVRELINTVVDVYICLIFL